MAARDLSDAVAGGRARRRAVTGRWESPFPIELLDRGASSRLGEIRAARPASAGGSRAGPTRAAARSWSAATPDGSRDAPHARGLQRPRPRPRVRRRGLRGRGRPRHRVRLRDRPAPPGRRARSELEPLTPDAGVALRRPIARPGREPAPRDPRGPRAGRRSRAMARPRTRSSRSTSRAARSRSSSRAPTSTPRRACRPDGRHAGLARVGPPEPAVGRHGAAPRRRGRGRLARRAARPSPAARRDWISQPRWSPDGVLHFIAEPDGWMNCTGWSDGRGRARHRPRGGVRLPGLAVRLLDSTASRRRLDRRGRPQSRGATGCTGSAPERRRGRDRGAVHRDELRRGRRRAGRVPGGGADRGRGDRRARPGDRRATRAPAALDDRARRPGGHLDPASRSSSRRPAAGRAFGLYYAPRNRAFRGPDGGRCRRSSSRATAVRPRRRRRR